MKQLKKVNTSILDTGPPPPENVDAVGSHPHGDVKGDVNPTLETETARLKPARQGYKKSTGLSPGSKSLPGEGWSRLFRAPAGRPTPDLARLLDKVERRINFYRSQIMSLVAVQGALQTELCRRQSIGSGGALE